MQQQSNSNKIVVKFDEVKPYLNCNKNSEYSFNCKSCKQTVNTIKPCFTIEVMDRTYTVRIYELVDENELRNEGNTTNHVVFMECLETGVLSNYQTHVISGLFNRPNTDESLKIAIRLTVTGKTIENRQALERFYEYEQFDKQLQLTGRYVNREDMGMIYFIGCGTVTVGKPHNYLGQTKQADKTSRAKNGHKYNIKDDDIASGNLLYYEFATYCDLIMVESLEKKILDKFESFNINLFAYLTNSCNINKEFRGKNNAEQRSRILDTLADIFLQGVKFHMNLKNYEKYTNLKAMYIPKGLTETVEKLLDELELKYSPILRKSLSWLIGIVLNNTDITLDEIVQVVQTKHKEQQEIIVDEVKTIGVRNTSSIKPPKKKYVPHVESEELKAKLDKLARY